MNWIVRALSIILSLQLLSACHSQEKLRASERFHDLSVGFQKHYRDYRRNCAKAAPEQISDMFADDPRPAYARKFLELSQEFPEDPVSEDAAIFVICNSANSDLANRLEAIRIVKERYTNSRKMIDVVPVLKYSHDKDLFDLEHLAVGLPAPEMTGEDADGKKMRLSDYRGKVVLISFFGDW